MNKEQKAQVVPLWKKMNLTMEEASVYSGIGLNTIRDLTNDPNCDFVLWVGTHRLLKRKMFEQFIERTNAI